MLAILVLGPTLFIMRDFVQNIGVYFRDVLPLTFSISAFEGAKGTAWQGSWTMFYWGWWMSWAPFVGVFIARISRGRTIREFVAGVLLVPTLVTFLWFSILGGTAIFRQMEGPGGLLESDGSIIPENVLFDVLQGLPLGSVLSVLAIFLITIFFVTASDSGSLVVDMLASGGNPDPPTWSRVLWASMEGVVAAGLLLAGGLTALQTGAIITALPFSLVMLAMCVATFRALRDEHKVQLRAERRQRREQLAREVGDDVTHELTATSTSISVSRWSGMLRRCSAPAPVLAGLPEAERNSPPRTSRPALEGLCGAGSDARSRAWTTLVPCRHPGQDAQGSTAGVRSIRPRTRSQRQCSWSAKQWLGSGQTRRPLRMWMRPTS